MRQLARGTQNIIVKQCLFIRAQITFNIRIDYISIYLYRRLYRALKISSVKISDCVAAFAELIANEPAEPSGGAGEAAAELQGKNLDFSLNFVNTSHSFHSIPTCVKKAIL